MGIAFLPCKRRIQFLRLRKDVEEWRLLPQVICFGLGGTLLDDRDEPLQGAKTLLGWLTERKTPFYITSDRDNAAQRIKRSLPAWSQNFLCRTRTRIEAIEQIAKLGRVERNRILVVDDNPTKLGEVYTRAQILGLAGAGKHASSLRGVSFERNWPLAERLEDIPELLDALRRRLNPEASAKAAEHWDAVPEHLEQVQDRHRRAQEQARAEEEARSRQCKERMDEICELIRNLPPSLDAIIETTTDPISIGRKCDGCLHPVLNAIMGQSCYDLKAWEQVIDGLHRAAGEVKKKLKLRPRSSLSWVWYNYSYESLVDMENRINRRCDAG